MKSSENSPVTSPRSRRITFLSSSLGSVATDVAARCKAVLESTHTTVCGAIIFLPKAFAIPIPKPGYPLLEPPASSYLEFQATPSNDSTVIADSKYFSDRSLQFGSWIQRAKHIRSSQNFALCTGNLSLALADVGAAYQTSSNGSTTILTLLPAAGALIGAPAEELWVLYKLMPLAGVLSVALSLGGNIIPRRINDYTNPDGLLDRGAGGTTAAESPQGSLRNVTIIDLTSEGTETQRKAEEFADMVHMKAASESLRPKHKPKLEITVGIIILCACLSLILTACWILQSGAIVVWWCTGKNWMFLWYGLTVMSSLLENISGTPFSKSWTIRVSKLQPLEKMHYLATTRADPISAHSPASSRENLIAVSAKEERSISSKKDEHETVKTIEFANGVFPLEETNLLKELRKVYRKKGYKAKSSQIIIEKTSTTSSNTVYVIFSIQGVHRRNAAFRLFSKLIAVGVFVFSTALFASSALVTILAATLTMTLVLFAGIFGRVAAMWISTVIMRDKHIIHLVVKEEQADRYMKALLARKGLIYEVLGHVITNGKCLRRYGLGLRWSMLLGVLAPPFHLKKVAAS
ncbi:uncharacterized protein BDR25DRAFT_367836 [Lindgomyces ingoldianus]|uniref:Uncharacterized protein n=1 Tax=Lindgomyces ingoldianus TaxID=673940 RepID=A0ACB6QWD5_9PLEO|nr:uncharacterized protein BDR25DRAFT_367836 [Lindgomyces ingoldianus]KAF2471137.1 hypothetical protein BDR25DRAFT_367836 [Lindgomyces ingoldianus]